MHVWSRRSQKRSSDSPGIGVTGTCELPSLGPLQKQVLTTTVPSLRHPQTTLCGTWYWTQDLVHLDRCSTAQLHSQLSWKKNILKLVYMYGCFSVFVSAYFVHAWYPQKPEEGIRSPGVERRLQSSVGARNWTQVLRKSSQCSPRLSQLPPCKLYSLSVL